MDPFARFQIEEEKNEEEQQLWYSHETRVNLSWPNLKKKRDEMNPSPTANQSFLHGDGKTALISNKVVYATLDSLALKRTRLPLQLLPVENDNVDKPDKKEKRLNGKTSIKRPSYKVRVRILYLLLLEDLRMQILFLKYPKTF